MIFGKSSTEDDTVVNLIASAVRRDISFGTLRPDSKLKLGDLRTRYGGSNHSVREALRMLSAEGLVSAEAQRGFRVASATLADLEDITRLRVEIESLALTWSIDNGGTAWEAQIVAAHHALARAEERVAQGADDLTAMEWDEAVRAFFTALISACGSPRLVEMQSRLFDQSRRIRLAALREGRLDFPARKARQIALKDAVVMRDKTTALHLLKQDIEEELAGT